MNNIGIDSLTSVITLTKRLKNISGTVQNLELKRVLVNLSMELSDVIIENIELKQEIEQLKSLNSIETEVTVKNIREHTKIDNDICPDCHDDKGNRVVLVNKSNNKQQLKDLMCPSCEVFYN